jgi:hypothetical protein
MVLETSVIINHLMRLIAREDFIKAGCQPLNRDVRLIPTSKKLKERNSYRLIPRVASLFWVTGNKEQLIITSIKPAETSTEIKIT